ncbi:TonB C-terminal domain-containing protein [Myxococcus sp. K15C18031901]|uniref:TonB C-terminal domain-containing protein n=1 Tax=Myxococcus dinghuensis TaxID=2906761 RepID=UPI0020A74EA7|nr:TonB C-terminal domain-containing protein [Myxococcus dinghuensis]MCP3102046.1 TonB C-terminal domain-containing protein [Myxococcus dinghuensis]
MSRRSRLTFAVLASVLLHAALFGVLSRMPSAPAPRVASQPVTEVEVVYVTPKAPEAPSKREATPSPPPTRQRVPPPSPVRPERPDAEVVAEAPTKAPPASAPESSGTPGADAPRAAEPPAISLMPKGLLGGEPVGRPFQTGRTLRNEPGALPDAKEVLRQEQARVAERVDTWSADAAATARARGGATPPYYANMRNLFSKSLVQPPPPDLKVLGARLKREQVEAIERFGKTGTPFAAEPRDRRLEQRNRLQAAVEAGRAANMYMMDVTEPVLALAAVVEVRQAKDGKLLDLKVLEGSGDAKFDAWALSHLENALASADPPPEEGVGVKADGLRSRWRLEEYLGNPRVKVILIGIY